MATVPDNLRGCGIKVSTIVKGVNVCGSGILYLTSNLEKYNYVLTAKHVFQEDSETPYNEKQLGHIELLYNDSREFLRLEWIKNDIISERIILFDQDLVIIKVNKNPAVTFQQILVSDELRDFDSDFFAWGIFAANEHELHRFDFGRNDIQKKRYRLDGHIDFPMLKGLSGAGLFSQSRSTLFGIISRYPNMEFQNATVDLVNISFSEINVKLKSLGLVELSTESSSFKREVGSEVVDIHQALINDTCVDLELARKRLSTDIVDDWFHDPLKYIDLLNQDYLFEQFEEYFNNKKYVANPAETFYVPKKKFTLRVALVSPFIDRIMYMACVGTLAPKLDKAQIANVYSARHNFHDPKTLIINGVEQWRKLQYQLQKIARQKESNGKYLYNCVIEIDILNFFDNISKDLLHSKILRVCETDNDRRAAETLKMILDKITEKKVGLPQNSDASALLASFYLNQVDVFMQHQAPEYYRFMDDIKIFCKNKYEARKILQTFEFELRRCYLSVNSQKTEIYTFIDTNEPSTTLQPDEKRRDDFMGGFNLEIAKISKYSRSNNTQYRYEAFHSSIKLLTRNIHATSDLGNDAEKEMNFALNSIAMLASKGLENSTYSSTVIDSIADACSELADRPWITTQLCKVLSLMPTEILDEYMIQHLKPIVLEEKYNTYSFQAYQIWLLLAKHKINHSDLKNYAVKSIEKNDDTNRPVIASMVIYMSSVDLEYRRVVLRKFEEGFTHGYFQNRIVLIALRSFMPDIVIGNTESCLEKSHKYTHKKKDKDLVFVRGFDEYDNENGEINEQLYSL